MGRNFFRFKQFLVHQENAAMKVGTDGVLLGAWADVSNVQNVLDVGTGTGLISLQIAQRCNAMIDAIEIDSLSAEQAKNNFISSPWNNRLIIENSSFQEYCKKTDKQYDLIVSNPPYFTNSLKSVTEKRNLVRHNDELPINDLLSGAVKLLNPDGRFCVVLPYFEGNSVIVKAIDYKLYCTKKLFVQTTPNKKVSRILIEFSFSEKVPIEDNISIHSLDGSYTKEYITLTADFYLAF